MTPPWHAISASTACERLDTEAGPGLSEQEVAARKARAGPNTLPKPPKKRPLQQLLGQLANPLVLALLVAAGIAATVAATQPSPHESFLARYGDTLAILLIVVVNAILGFVQERRAEAALEALERMASPSARVVRGGRTTIVPAADLVPGDVVEVEAGDAIPADLRLLSSAQAQADEAAMTGESTPVLKDAQAIHPEEQSVAERSNMAWMGTTLVRGRARAIVVQTGATTELGRIGAMLRAAGREPTPLEQRLASFGRVILLACVALSAVLFIVGLLRSGQSWTTLLLTAVSLAVAAIPEGLPAITTITLALGMQRMARRGAIVRKLPAVETLGSATVICADKTGTLTQNAMIVRHVVTVDASYEVSGEGYSDEGAILEGGEPVGEPDAALRTLLEAAVLCNEARLEPGDDGAMRVIGDPTEGALLALAAKGGLDRQALHDARTRLRDVPFDADRKRMTQVWSTASGEVTAWVKGSPEVVLERCKRIRAAQGVRAITAEDQRRFEATNEALADEALRVLAFAEGPAADTGDPEADLIFLGLVAMKDPPRPEARAAVAECQAAGIRVVMITGDHRNTAVAIARELGIWRAGGRVMDGVELARIGEAGLADVIEEVVVFARVAPEQKLQIVQALRRHGHVVAMTGDGVNDAPALREAQIGVAMGRGGTDVAREAAAMVLADDRFATLTHAVREGRAIFRNIQKFIFFLNSSNAGLAIAVIAAYFFEDAPPLTPLQLLWVNLVTNGLPALALGVEPPGGEQMHDPPRPPREPILGLGHYAAILAIGLVMAASALSFYSLADLVPGIFRGATRTERLYEARSLAFTLLALSPLFHAFGCRSFRRSLFAMNPFSNRVLWGAVAASAGVHLVAVAVPALHPVFHTEWPTASQWAVLLGLAVLPIPTMELLKSVARRRDGRGPVPSAAET